MASLKKGKKKHIRSDKKTRKRDLGNNWGGGAGGGIGKSGNFGWIGGSIREDFLPEKSF